MPLNYYTGYDSTLEADLGVHSAEMGLYLEPVKSQGVHQWSTYNGDRHLYLNTTI